MENIKTQEKIILTKRNLHKYIPSSTKEHGAVLALFRVVEAHRGFGGEEEYSGDIYFHEYDVKSLIKLCVVEYLNPKMFDRSKTILPRVMYLCADGVMPKSDEAMIRHMFPDLYDRLGELRNKLLSVFVCDSIVAEYQKYKVNI